MSNRVLPLSMIAARLHAWATSATAARSRANDPDRQAAYDALVEQYETLAAAVKHHEASAAALALQAGAARQAPMPRPRVASVPGARHASRINALEFWRRHGIAVAGCRAEWGFNWTIKAPFGETLLVMLPTAYRSFKTERGTQLRWPTDQRIPAARYWPGGEIPAGLTYNEDYARDPETGNDRTMWKHHLKMFHWTMADRSRSVGDDRAACDAKARTHLASLLQHRRAMLAASTPLWIKPRDDAWYPAHGYVRHGGQWCQPMQVRSVLAQKEQIEANAAWLEAKRVALAEAEEAERELAEAAD